MSLDIHDKCRKIENYNIYYEKMVARQWLQNKIYKYCIVNSSKKKTNLYTCHFPTCTYTILTSLSYADIRNVVFILYTLRYDEGELYLNYHQLRTSNFLSVTLVLEADTLVKICTVDDLYRMAMSYTYRT